MPGIKSVTITVEFNDGSTEVATVEHPREATITNRDTRSPKEFDPYRAHIPEPPSFDVDLAMKDASGIVWRAHPAPTPQQAAAAARRHITGPASHV